MKKLITTSLALMLMAFTGQSLSGELESKAGESSSQCGKYAGDWYLVQGNDKKDDFFFGKYTIKNDGTATWEVFYGYSDFEQGTYASNIECKNGIIIDTAVGSQDVIKFQVKKHTASNLDLNILHEGKVAGVESYTSSFKEPILGFELSKSNNILYRKALDKLNRLNRPNKEFKKTEVIKGRKIIHANNDNLRAIVKNEIQKQGTYIADLNHIDVSKVTYLTRLFHKSKFNGDISGWDVSNVTDMEGMFNGSKFNGNVSEWDVSNVEIMKRMFMKSKFSGDISEWDVSNVTDMKYMFVKSVFNRDISSWDVSGFSKLRMSPNGYDKMIGMFFKAEFKGDISNWKASNSTVWNIVHQEIKRLGTTANLNHIDVSNVTNMSRMFRRSEFNGDISGWNVSNVTDMEGIFHEAKFNGDISGWNVSNVTDMESMFYYSKFNSDISGWDVSNVTENGFMFSKALNKKKEYQPKFKH